MRKRVEKRRARAHGRGGAGGRSGGGGAGGQEVTWQAFPTRKHSSKRKKKSLSSSSCWKIRHHDTHATPRPANLHRSATTVLSIKHFFNATRALMVMDLFIICHYNSIDIFLSFFSRTDAFVSACYCKIQPQRDANLQTIFFFYIYIRSMYTKLLRTELKIFAAR